MGQAGVSADVGAIQRWIANSRPTTPPARYMTAWSANRGALCARWRLRWRSFRSHCGRLRSDHNPRAGVGGVVRPHSADRSRAPDRSPLSARHPRRDSRFPTTWCSRARRYPSRWARSTTGLLGIACSRLPSCPRRTQAGGISEDFPCHRLAGRSRHLPKVFSYRPAPRAVESDVLVVVVRHRHNRIPIRRITDPNSHCNHYCHRFESLRARC